MKRIHRFPALTAVTILLLVMAATGAASHVRAQDPAYEQGELRVYVCCASGEADLAIREQINKAFEAAHPGVTVKQEVLPANTNYFEKLQTMIAAGDTPDVFDMWEGFVQPYAEAGHLLALDPYMQPGGLTKDQFDPQILELNSWNGQLYSLPIEYVPYPAALFYNPKLFQEAGLQPPDATWTWTELRDAAIKLTKSDGGDTQQWGLLYDYAFYPQWLSWIWSSGTDFFNADQTKCNLTDPAAVSALQFWADLVNKDKVVPPPGVVESFQGVANGFKAGNVAMYFGAGWDPPGFDAVPDLQYGMAPLPKSPTGGQSTYLMNLTWGISAKTEMPRTAWEYARYFATEGERLRLESISSVPSYLPLASEWLTPEKEAKGYQLYLDGVQHANVPGAGAKWEKISVIAQSELDLLFAGDASAEDVAKRICTQVDRELAR
ncbi:MAG: multiple sugar transport system substrate-binding protein [Thermomicrobiales bacterium]|jgi:ABC-type glycerol-3-phosphate transport system substrate-binding protein|nr:multiple sugar transport system substrate-binding protein [Thermomicrobiales bacterium]